MCAWLGKEAEWIRVTTKIPCRFYCYVSKEYKDGRWGEKGQIFVKLEVRYTDRSNEVICTQVERNIQIHS